MLEQAFRAAEAPQARSRRSRARSSLAGETAQSGSDRAQSFAGRFRPQEEDEVASLRLPWPRSSRVPLRRRSDAPRASAPRETVRRVDLRADASSRPDARSPTSRVANPRALDRCCGLRTRLASADETRRAARSPVAAPTLEAPLRRRSAPRHRRDCRHASLRARREAGRGNVCDGAQGSAAANPAGLTAAGP